MNSPQLWLALLVVVIVVLLAWLEQRRRDAELGGSELGVFVPAPPESDAPDLSNDLLDEVAGCDGCDSLAVELLDQRDLIKRLQHNNRMLRELLSVTLSHIRGMDRRAEMGKEE